MILAFILLIPALIVALAFPAPLCLLALMPAALACRVAFFVVRKERKS